MRRPSSEPKSSLTDAYMVFNRRGTPSRTPTVVRRLCYATRVANAVPVAGSTPLCQTSAPKLGRAGGCRPAPRQECGQSGKVRHSRCEGWLPGRQRYIRFSLFSPGNSSLASQSGVPPAPPGGAPLHQPGVSGCGRPAGFATNTRRFGPRSPCRGVVVAVPNARMGSPEPLSQLDDSRPTVLFGHPGTRSVPGLCRACTPTFRSESQLLLVSLSMLLVTLTIA